MPDIPPEERQRIVDEEHLRLLTIGHYIAGGLYIAFASMFVFHLIFLVFLSANPDVFTPPGKQVQPMPENVIYAMTVAVGFFVALGWTIGGLTIYAGRCIRNRAHRTFTIVMAAVNLLLIPIGTILGVFTLMVVTRESVRRMYGS
jgi:hypothetical protein